MRWTTGALSFALLLGAALPAFAQDTLVDDGLSAQDPTIVRGCNYGEVIDSTTPAQTKAKLEAAGYSSVQVLRKGCDNVWHARRRLWRGPDPGHPDARWDDRPGREINFNLSRLGVDFRLMRQDGGWPRRGAMLGFPPWKTPTRSWA